MEEVGAGEIPIQIDNPQNDPPIDGMGRDQVRVESEIRLAILGNDPPRTGGHDVEQGGGQQPAAEAGVGGAQQPAAEAGVGEDQQPDFAEAGVEEAQQPAAGGAGAAAEAGVGGAQQPAADQQGLNNAETIQRRLTLHKAAITGDWTTAEDIINEHPEEDLANITITNLGQTALHIATLAEKTKFVSRLVRKMNEQGLTHQDTQNDTALCLASITGKTELAVAMLKRMQELPNLENGETLATMRGRDRRLPLHFAVFSGHRNMVEYLYKETKNQLQDEGDLRDLLVALSTLICSVSRLFLSYLYKDRKIRTPHQFLPPFLLSANIMHKNNRNPFPYLGN